MPVINSLPLSSNSLLWALPCDAQAEKLQTTCLLCQLPLFEFWLVESSRGCCKDGEGRGTCSIFIASCWLPVCFLSLSVLPQPHLTSSPWKQQVVSVKCGLEFAIFQLLQKAGLMCSCRNSNIYSCYSVSHFRGLGPCPMSFSFNRRQPRSSSTPFSEI